MTIFPSFASSTTTTATVMDRHQGKRKASSAEEEDLNNHHHHHYSNNPLLNAAAAKRAKKDAAKHGSGGLKPSTKRKLNHEENSLLIVRAQDSQPSNSDMPASSTMTTKKPNSTTASSSQPPPAKKFKADSGSQPPPSRTRGASNSNYNVGSDMEHQQQVEKDVQAMDDEVDTLRRLSRARMTIDPSIVDNNHVAFSPSSLSRRAGMPTTPRGGGGSRKGKSKEVVKEMTIPVALPEEEMERMERNKQIRAGAMAAIVHGQRGEDERGQHYNDDERREESRTRTSRGHRRKSSVSGRGKRVSSLFEATGMITQPHNSVSETSFYKHIDGDLPDSERIRQLLVWCSLRAASSMNGSGAASSSSTQVPPALSDEALGAIKVAQEEVVRNLAEKKSDVGFSSSSSNVGVPSEELGENEQNIRNRKWEVTYTGHIQQAQAEEEAWKKVSYGYDLYAKKLQTSCERRMEELGIGDGGGRTKGKGRARMIPEEHELKPEFRSALGLAKRVLGVQESGGREIEREIEQRLGGMEYMIDQIYGWMSGAKGVTDVGERMVDERFKVLNRNLESRLNPFEAAGSSSSSSSGVLLSSAKSPDADVLMRALTRVDELRPASDAARRAAREVERAGETGGIFGRLTTTPNRRAGTPKR